MPGEPHNPIFSPSKFYHERRNFVPLIKSLAPSTEYIPAYVYLRGHTYKENAK